MEAINSLITKLKLDISLVKKVIVPSSIMNDIEQEFVTLKYQSICFSPQDFMGPRSFVGIHGIVFSETEYGEECVTVIYNKI